MLRCLPLLKACNQQVDYVDKRHCNLFAVPDDVLRYTSTLEELLLDANQIRELPRGLFRLQELRKLTLSDNEICRLPPDIANFLYLQELDVSRNDIEDIPENIKYCKNLQVADFSCNPLQRLPDGFSHLKNLTHLGLNDVSLTRLPNDIGSLSNLESLELRENLIKYLPTSLSLLVKLKTLDLGSNLIDELPDTIGLLPSLEELWLDCNEISELPPAIGNLRNLTQLDVSENKLEQLPEEISGLTQLTDFILSQNHIEYLPEGIGNLKRLLILKVDQNQLVRLTPTLGNCENLQELLLTENLLTEMPPSIGRLKNLTILNVDRNQLVDIPREIGSCSRLSVLSLRDNRIARLPNDLGNLRDLHVLDVCGNRLQYLPLSLGSCSLKAVWLSENQIQPLLKFQTDTDEITGLKVLTCFLLPQQAYQLECLDNMMKDVQPGTADQGDCGLWNKNLQPTSVKFEDDNEGYIYEESHFVRHNTPHPKELRARHSGKLVKKDAGEFYDGTNHCSPPMPVNRTSAAAAAAGEYSGGAVASTSSGGDREICFSSNESQSSKSSEMSAGSRASTVRVQSEALTPIDDTATSGVGVASSRHVVPRQHQIGQQAAVINHYTAPSHDTIRYHDNRTPVASSAAGSGSGSCRTSFTDRDVEMKDVSEFQNDEVYAAGMGDAVDDDDDDASPVGGRHVEFSPEVEVERRHRSPTELNDNGNGSDSSTSSRLQRRDTPHHLKNKRVHTTNSAPSAITAAARMVPDNIASGGDFTRSPPLEAAMATESGAREPPATSTKTCATDDAPAEGETDCLANLVEIGAMVGGRRNSEDVVSTDSLDESRPKRRLSRQSGRGYCESFDSWAGDLPAPVLEGELQIDNDRELPPPPSCEELTMQPTTTSGVNGEASLPPAVVMASSPGGPVVAAGTLQKVIRVLRDAGVPLGMSVAGGNGSAPHGRNNEGIFISRVAEDGPSAAAGLRAGDRLLSVNGTSVRDMDHQSVVSLLKEAGTSVCLVISRQIMPFSNNQQTLLVTLERDENGLGFTIAGGRGSTPYKGNDQSIYISRITEGGAAARDGHLRVGDKLISVNGIDITVAPHDQAVALLTGIRGEISLVISREAAAETPSGIIAAPFSASMTTVASPVASAQLPTSLSRSIDEPRTDRPVADPETSEYVDVAESNRSALERTQSPVTEMMETEIAGTADDSMNSFTADDNCVQDEHLTLPQSPIPQSTSDVSFPPPLSPPSGFDENFSLPAPSNDDDNLALEPNDIDSNNPEPALSTDAAAEDTASATGATESETAVTCSTTESTKQESEPSHQSNTDENMPSLSRADSTADRQMSRTLRTEVGGSTGSGVTSSSMAECLMASYKMVDELGAAAAAAVPAEGFLLTPPECLDIAANVSDVHEMIQSELMQTVTLL